MGTNQKANAEAIGSVPRCRSCRSERVVRDAYACFNRESGLWELENVFDHAHCHKCENGTELEWVSADALQNTRIRELNDRFRTIGTGNGTMLITSGLQGKGSAFVVQAVDAVRTFTAFSRDNDPWGEHDFGEVEIDGEKVFFKIDAYNLDCTAGSENPANEALTHRVLTIMLASEY
ncbi:DUF3768 domain-containing protein [uncultured Roseobacter sp.]|uniref:DUF3768 domain-containing protein n=1 Tax=uncultured Roseobacter sp. TaxID=114847 RepID=UPI0026232B87|nr:DUF3768 domain-containing protein [uncultured Roseobacter sp.]